MLAVALFALCGLAYVASPLLVRRDEGSDPAEAERGLAEARELQSRHTMLLASLKDLEDDRLTEKLSEADYVELKQRLTDEAVETMRAIDAHEEARKRPLPRGPRPLPDPEPEGDDGSR